MFAVTWKLRELSRCRREVSSLSRASGRYMGASPRLTSFEMESSQSYSLFPAIWSNSDNPYFDFALDHNNKLINIKISNETQGAQYNCYQLSKPEIQGLIPLAEHPKSLKTMRGNIFRGLFAKLASRQSHILGLEPDSGFRRIATSSETLDVHRN